MYFRSSYDTLHNIIGINGKENIGSLKEYGVKYKQVDLLTENLTLKKLHKFKGRQEYKACTYSKKYRLWLEKLILSIRDRRNN